MKTETKNNALVSADILPIISSKRSLSGLGFANIWIGMAIVIAVFSFGASGIDGMSIWGVATATFVANIVIALIGSLTGDIGVEHGLSFATYLRAPFGIHGVHIPAISRGIVASCWFGINTYIGATAINYFTLALFNVDNWFLWFIIFAIVQIINTMLGMKAIDKFASIASPCIILITCWMFYKVNSIAILNNINILGYDPPNPTPEIWMVTMCANIGMWAALAVDIPNITRSLKAPIGERKWLKRNKNNWIPQFATLPIIEAFIAVIGAISYLTTGNWNPVEVIQSEAQGVTLIVLLLMVILAQWSTNTAANLVPPAMCFTNAGAKWKLPYKVAVLIAGLIGVCVQPWDILNQLYTYLGYFASFLSALAGIMLCDYYIIRKRRINVQDLYKTEGQYKYHGGINVVGMIAWLLGTGAAVLGSSYGYFCGLPVGFVVYLVLMKVWYLKKFPQAEVESNYSDKYLGISVGNDWVVEGYEEKADDVIDVFEDIKVEDYTGIPLLEEALGGKVIITFGRQYGSRGKELAGMLAKELNIPFYDEDMIKLAARKMNVDESMIEKLEDAPRKELVHAMTSGTMFAAKEYEASNTDKMFNVQSKIIKDLANKSTCIIVGRCANYVLEKANIPTTDIFVVANVEDRIKRIVERDKTTYEKAKSYVHKTEKCREAYFNYYTSYEWGNPQYYDICVNTSSLPMEDITKHLAAYVKKQ